MSFLWPWVFVILPLPWLVRQFFRAAKLSTGGALRVPFYNQLVSAEGGGSKPSARRPVLLLLASLIWVLLVAAVARPVMLGDAMPLPREGRDLMLAIDLSGSMGRDDLSLGGREVSRLEVVKDAARDFINRREGDRLGLVLFSDRAYLQAPLTFDRRAVSTLLNEAQVGLTGQQTAIGDAIGVAIKRLKDRPAKSRVLVLLTDGANNTGILDPMQAAKLAKEYGIRVYTIGVGGGTRVVRTPFGSQRVNPSQDLDEATLKKIAETTGGRYFRARDIKGLASVYAEIDKLEPASGKSESVRPVIDLYDWPLGIALILSFLLALGYLLPGTINTPMRENQKGT